MAAFVSLLAKILYVAGVILVVVGLLPNFWSFGLYLLSRAPGKRCDDRKAHAQERGQACELTHAHAQGDAPAQGHAHAHAQRHAHAQGQERAAAGCATSADAPVEAARRGAPLSFAVIICAHNEESVVGRCVRSVLAQEYPDFECFVVADGCTDKTACRAREAGATVLERCSDGPSTKGQVLEFGVAHVLEMRDFDCVCIFDSDNTVDRAFLSRVAGELEAGSDAVSGLRLSSNADNTLVASLYAAYWGMSQSMYASSHASFGLNAPASGTGFAFRVCAWPADWHLGSIAEDCEMSVQLGLDGKRIGYDPAAQCRDEQPEDVRSMIRQLRRWRTGCSQVAKQYARPVFAQFVQSPSITSWDLLTLLLEFVCMDALMAGMLTLLLAGLLEAHAMACLVAATISYAFMLCVGVFSVAECGQVRKHMVGTVLCYPLFLTALGVVGLSSWVAPCRQWNRVVHSGR